MGTGAIIRLPDLRPIEVLLPAARIAARVAELGAAISGDYAGRSPVFVSCLKGGIVFLADLMRAVTVPHEIDFLAVSSYGIGTRSSGLVRLSHDLASEVRGRDLLLVDDVVDTGNTARFLMDHLKLRRPASLRICSLLAKRIDGERQVEPDFVGFQIPSRFVIGYGMDLGGRYRHLPYVAALDPEDERRFGPLAPEPSARTATIAR